MISKTRGEVAYDAYSEAVDHKNYQCLPISAWPDLTDAIRVAWEAAAEAAVDDYVSNRQADEENS